jgi:chromosome segregation ATPase
MLRETQSSREQELSAEVESLRASLVAHTAVAKDEGVSAEADAQKKIQDKKIADLETELANWEDKHQAALASMGSSEKQFLDTVAELERQVSAVGAQKAGDEELVNSLQREIEEHKAAVASNATRVAELEQSHASTLEQLDEATKSREINNAEIEGHKTLITRLEQQIGEHEHVVKAHQDGLALLHATHARELDEIKSSSQADYDFRVAELTSKHQENTAALEATLAEARGELSTIATQVAFALGLDVSTEKLQERISDLLADQKALAQEQQKSSEMEKTVIELSAINDTVMNELATVKSELAGLLLQTVEAEKLKIEHAAVTAHLAALKTEMTDLESKNQKNSRLVEELEDQLASNFDQHQMTNNRLSTLQTERSAKLEEAHANYNRVQTELDAVKDEYNALQVSDTYMPFILPPLTF